MVKIGQGMDSGTVGFMVVIKDLDPLLRTSVAERATRQATCELLQRIPWKPQKHQGLDKF
jgi:hypothetical protein